MHAPEATQPTAEPASRWIRLLVAWTDMVHRNAAITVAASLVIAGLLGFYAAANLGVNGDTDGMISDHLPWRGAYLDFQRAFPQLENEFQVVIDAVSPELAERAQRDLAAAIASDVELFEGVFAPGSDPFFELHALDHLDAEELESIRDGLAENGDWLLRLEAQPGLAGAAAVIRDELEAGGAAGLHVLALLGGLGETLLAQLEHQPFQLSWQEKLGGKPIGGARRRFVFAYPRLDFADPLPARAAYERLHERIDGLVLPPGGGATIRVTGAQAIEHEQVNSATRSTRRAAVGAALLVLLVVYLGLRSVRLSAASLITLIAGLCATAAFAAVSVGRLNLISIAFAVLYIGLGIDYALHYTLGYAESLTRAGSAAGAQGHADARRQAIARTTRRVGTALFLSAVTTAACFYAFVPTDFVGVAELGLIGGTGMLIGVITTLTLLPALLSVRPFRIGPEDPALARLAKTAARQRAAGAWLGRRRRSILISVAVAAALAVVALPVRFDHDPVNLTDQGTESFRTYRSLLNDPNTAPLTVSVLAAGPAEAERLVGRIEALTGVERVLSIRDFLPTDDARKRSARADIAAQLDGPGPDAISNAEGDDAGDVGADTGGDEHAERLRALDELASLAIRAGFRFDGDTTALLAGVRILTNRWKRWLDPWPLETQRALSAELEERLVGGLPPMMAKLRSGARGGGAARLEDLPAGLRERWIAADGRLRLQVVPTGRLETFEQIRTFVDDVRGEVPEATGAPVNHLEVSRVAIGAFRRALGLALLATAIVLMALLRRPRATLAVLATLSLAGLFTFGFAAAVDLPLNFANIITLPLIFGLGVDGGIHMLHRRGLRGSDENLLGTSTARAILFSGLTTVASFGSLALSSHVGLSTMGRMLTIGMVSVLACTLLALPAWLERGSGRSDTTSSAEDTIGSR